MTTSSPLLVAHLFGEISVRLLMLLRSLDRDEWQRPTLSSKRCVKDIAAHLLDGSLRRLSLQRDGYHTSDRSTQPETGETLLEFLKRLNGEWETATRRLSPRVLIDLIEWADGRLAELFESLDPDGAAIFPVAWAGEDESRNWMDVAREYTEKWHHTQQIFTATGRASTITERRLFHPCLDTFLRALPYTFQAVEAREGTIVNVTVTGEAGGEWLIGRVGQSWIPLTESADEPAARFTISQDSAWKLFTKRLEPDESLRCFPDIRIDGDESLGRRVLEMVSVMA